MKDDLVFSELHSKKNIFHLRPHTTKSAGSGFEMDTKLVSEDIGSEPSKVKNNEESWIKMVKIKFKAGGNLENDSEEDEKLRKIVKGGTMDEIKENNKKINNKHSNNKNDVRKPEGMGESEVEKENRKRIKAKGKKRNQQSWEGSKNNNNNNNNNKGLEGINVIVIGKRKLSEELEQSTENKEGGMMNANKDDKKDYKKEKRKLTTKRKLGKGKVW